MKKPEAESVLTVPDAAAARTKAEGVVLRLRAIISGEVRHQSQHSVERQVIGRTGRAETITVEEPLVTTEQTTPLQRLQARRELGRAEDELLVAEEALEAAKAAAAQAERQHQAQTIAAGTQVVRRALPPLLAELRALQQKFQAYHRELEQLDGQVGRRYFLEQAVCPMFAPGGMADGWVAFIAQQGFPPESR